MNRKITYFILSFSGLTLMVILFFILQTKAPSGTPLPQPERTSVRSLLIVCEEWKPYEYVENGEMKGIDVDIVHTIMNRLNIPYKIMLVPWPRALKMLKTGKADTCFSVSYASSREDFLFYTEDQKAFAETGVMPKDYMYISDYVFFIRKLHETSLKYESYDQIIADGYRVGINQDYTYTPEFLEAKLNTVTHIHPKDSFKALMAGEIDVFACEKALGLAYTKEMNLSEEITYISKPIFTKPYLLPFAKNSTYPQAEHVMKQFYSELRKIRETGEYQAIYDKYTK